MSCAGGCGFHGDPASGLCSHCSRRWTRGAAAALEAYGTNTATLLAAAAAADAARGAEAAATARREAAVRALRAADAADPRRAARTLTLVTPDAHYGHPLACEPHVRGIISWFGEPHAMCVQCNRAMEGCGAGCCSLCTHATGLSDGCPMELVHGVFLPDPRGDLSRLHEFDWDRYVYVYSDGAVPTRVSLDRASLAFKAAPA